MLLTQLETEIKSVTKKQIVTQRKVVLQPLIDFIQNKVDGGENIYLNFICTHNSRRSHLAQIWAVTAAEYYHIPNVFCFSGGTEVTALYPMVVQTLQQSGFQIQKMSTENNPIYGIKYTANKYPIIGFSKLFDNPFNPISDFAAIMTCAHADNNCPYIVGGETRITITYEDPKVYDNTPEKEEKYMERSYQIANEMFYIFSQILKLK